MTHLLDTPVCAMLAIEVPILSAPMGGVAGPELAAAVSNAGGLGVIGLATFDLDETRPLIRAAKAATDRPFGVGILFPAGAEGGEEPRPESLPDFLRHLVPEEATTAPMRRRSRLDHAAADMQLTVAIEEGVRVLLIGLGTPRAAVERAKAAGMTVVSLVGSLRAAEVAERDGADIIVAQGHEAGGHTGRTATLVIVPQVVDAVRVPVLAAGGIVDGRGLAAALMLGAAGVLVGTRFLATPEARTADSHKARVVAMRSDETLVSRCYTGKPSRILRNAFTDAWAGHEAEILPMPRQWARVEPLAGPAKAAGSLELANWPTGQGAVLVDAIRPAGEIVAAMARDAAALLGRPAALLPVRGVPA